MMASANDTTRVRLVELLAALSLGTDLGLGLPMEHVLRQTFIALRLGERLGMRADELATIRYVSLLSWIGCHVDAHEQAKWFGDEQATRRAFYYVDEGRTLELLSFFVRNIGAGSPPLRRARLGVAFLGDGLRDMATVARSHCGIAEALAERLGLGEAVRTSLAQTFERWDGKGDPNGMPGAEIRLPARLVNLADVVEVFERAGGVATAIEVAERRRGGQFDPELVELFRGEAVSVFADLDAVASPRLLASITPVHDTELSGERLDSALDAIAEFVDLKLPYAMGHSRGVADLAAGAASALGLPASDARLLRRAALVHDLGRLGVSNAIWDKSGPLDHTEMERIRLHPYLTERMLAVAPGLAVLGTIAAQHHERLDGSGYPHRSRGDALSMAVRVLAAADAYRASCEPRPHRPASTAADAAASVRDDVRAGRLDGGAVDAVLAAAGHRPRRRGLWPAGLTAREVEVLRLVAGGHTHAEIAARLVISRKTARNHIEHVYLKIGASNRATASVFALRHGLLTGEQLDDRGGDASGDRKDEAPAP
jgi:HD-GYP domain-containing protein (c-di-GMP phosphodiesterase class II)